MFISKLYQKVLGYSDRFVPSEVCLNENNAPKVKMVSSQKIYSPMPGTLRHLPASDEVAKTPQRSSKSRTYDYETSLSDRPIKPLKGILKHSKTPSTSTHPFYASFIERSLPRKNTTFLVKKNTNPSTLIPKTPTRSDFLSSRSPNRLSGPQKSDMNSSSDSIYKPLPQYVRFSA